MLIGNLILFVQSLGADIKEMRDNIATKVDSNDIGTNATGNRTVSTEPPTGGEDSDIWYRIL